MDQLRRRPGVTGCWKVASGGCCELAKEKNNNHKHDHIPTYSDDRSVETTLDNLAPPRAQIRPCLSSTLPVGQAKCRRQRRRSSQRKPRKHSESSSVGLAGFDDEEEEDEEIGNHSYLKPHVGAWSAPGTDFKKTKIKKILLCGRGLHDEASKEQSVNPDTVNITGELSPTLAATILNWQQFNKDLVMMKTHRNSCKSDSEIEPEDVIPHITRSAPIRPTLNSHRRQSTTAIHADGDGDDDTVQAEKEIITASSAVQAAQAGTPVTARSAVLPRRHIRDLPVAASTDTGLMHMSKLAGPSSQRMQRRGAVIGENEDEGRAIARSPLPLARTNAQLDLFANLNKEHATRYWAETAATGEHIWIATGASTECYIGDVDCSKTGDKLKCAACHVIVHEGCLGHMRKMNFNCKLTYREAHNKLQKEQNLVVHHHWVHKWRQEGRCKACGKSFQSKFLNRELVAIACSWCKIAYHNKHGCFTMNQIEESCTMGPLKDVIIPPSWVIKLPPRRISTIRKRHVNSNYSGKKRKRSRKVTSDRLFVVKPQPPLDKSPRCPLLIFVNPKSGGNKGAKILHTLHWLVNPRQVFDVAALFGPRFGLEMFRKLLPHLRVLVCGGDGTVGWVLSTLDSLKWPVYPPIGIVPLGTGNDLARTLGWGAAYADEPMSELLIAVSEETMVVQLDRWIIEVTPNAELDTEVEGSDEGTVQNLPLTVMNNYFSIGADAHVALQFHESRSANPEVFNSRLKNRLFYGGIGTKDLFKRTWKDLSEHISLFCDGVDLTWKVQELKLHCILFLNIPRYAGGTLPWGTTHPCTASGVGAGSTTSASQQNSMGAPSSPSHSPQFSPPSYSDGRVEVLGFTSATLAALQVGGRGERIAQCSVIKIVTRKAIPAQVDGEPCKLAPSVIELRFHSRVPMLQRISSKSTSRRGSSHAPLINSDPVNVCGARALYTSVLLRLPVAVVSKTDYDANKQDITQLLTSAVYVGDITVESETDLDQVRGIVQRLLADHRALFPCQNLSDWAFLDYVSNDSVFRLNQSQESFQSVSDICNIDNTLLIMHPGFQKPLTFLPNGRLDSGGSRNERLCLLRDLKLDNASEAVRIVFSSEDEETKI